jgi:hypothetical protein
MIGQASTEGQDMSEAATIDLTKVTQAVIAIRDARTKLAAEFDTKDKELVAAKDKLEAILLDHLNKQGIDSVKTEVGTFYRQVEIKPSCADWDVLNKWVAEYDAWDVYERRIKKTFVAQYMEAHEGAMPPGVNVHREYVVRVRRV